MKHSVVLTTECSALKLVNRGKVRDIYDMGDSLLMISTDRLSAFDVVMNEGIPEKGRVLTRMTEFWLRQLSDIVPNHLITSDVSQYPEACRQYADMLEGRSMHDQVHSFKGAAAALELNPATLYSRMNKLGIRPRRQTENGSA